MSLSSPSVFSRVRRLTTRAALAVFCLFGAAIAHANITDNFQRANGAALGNGWIEKTPSAFSISNNAVSKAAGSGYRDNIAYRPAAEDVADVEASVELRLTTGGPGYPQIHTRVQSGTAAFDDWLDSYVLYVGDSTTSAVLGRQNGNSFVTSLATITISPALNTTDTFRLRLRSTGSSPVTLNAYVERLSGASWTIIGQASVDDSSAQRITGAGSVGFSGYIETAYAYDNFVRTNIGGGSPSNPVPATTSLSPSSALQGENGVTVTVNGSNFVAGAEVRWNGAARTTTFISANVLEASIPAGDLAASGTASVSVFNPAPGGGLSNAQTFTINPNGNPNPVPVASSLSPTNRTEDTAAFTLTVNGNSFATNAVVRWNGSNRTTTFVSATQVRAAITAADIANPGTASVTVFNPAPGGGVSGALTFTINPVVVNNPVPTLSSLNPASRGAGSGAFTLTVNGTNFVSGSIVRWNGSNRTTTFVSPTTLTAAITAADVSSAGTVPVRVFNPTPGGGQSGAVNFTVTSGGGSGGPSITSLAPLSATIGSASAQVTITGSGFTASSVVRWNGDARATTLLSSTQVRATLSSADLASDRIGAITVANGTSVSGPLSFFVLPAGDSVLFDGFNRAASQTVGNGWVEKTPSAFQILSNGTLWGGDTFPLDFHDAIVYRPLSESQLDSESGVEFTRLAGARFPQVHARVQGDSITQSDTLESYILYVEDGIEPNALAIAVQPPVTDFGECIIRVAVFPTLPQVGQRYRLRLRVEGTYPVQLTGSMERFNGGAWEPFVSASVTHDANTQQAGYFCPYASVPNPISTAGSFGLAKWYDPTDGYDNFYWRSLSPGGPVSNVPALTGMSPGSTTAGSGAFTLTVTGANFNSNSTVRWNGADRTTTFLSGNQLQAAIPASDVAAVGTAAITVFNSGANGGSSQSQTFNINAPPPTNPGASFTDAFTRANSSVLGNGWIQKTPAAFMLENNQARKQAVDSNYRDNPVYRPSNEGVLHSEVAAEMRLFNTNVGYPQLFARLQSGTAQVADQLDAYMLYFNGTGSQAVLGRQRGATFVTTLATINLPTPLNTTDTFRLRLRATGASPVELQAFVERLESGNWTIVGQTTATDSSTQRISTAGVGGFGGYTENSFAFDNFTVTTLTP